MPRKTLRWALYIIAMTCLAIWLAVSTSLIAFLNSSNPIQKISMDKYQQKDYIGYTFEEIGISNSITKKFFLSGYLITDTITEESMCSILFLGKEKSYKIPLSVKTREDIGTIVNNIAFTCDTSTIAMQDDLYNVYFYYWANDSYFGTMDTYYQFKKNGTETSLFFWRSEKVDHLIETTNQDYFFGGIDNMYSNSGLIDVQGWGAISDLSCETQIVYIEFIDTTGRSIQYTTKQVMRGDVSYAYENPLLEESGFFASFSIGDLADGDYTVRALIQQKDLVQSSVPCSITKTSNGIIWHK